MTKGIPSNNCCGRPRLLDEVSEIAIESKLPSIEIWNNVELSSLIREECIHTAKIRHINSNSEYRDKFQVNKHTLCRYRRKFRLLVDNPNAVDGTMFLSTITYVIHYIYVYIYCF